MLRKEELTLLKSFIQLCQKNPALLHTPELDFFRDFIKSLGGDVGEAPTQPPPPQPEPQQPKPAAEEEEPAEEESDVDLDMEGIIRKQILVKLNDW